MEIVTASRLRAFRTCKRYHRLRYEERRRPVARSLPLSFGTAFHRGLEAWWQALANNACADDTFLLASTAMSTPREGEELEIDEYEFARATELLRAYHARWYTETSAFVIIGVEVEFNGPLVNPKTGRASKLFTLGGKIDALCLRPGHDRPSLVEHKTSAEDITAGSSYWAKLRLDGQVSTYFEGGRFLGHDIGSCLYDVVKKPQLRPRLATPEESRRWTQGKRCAPCTKRHAEIGAADAQGGYTDCATCAGSGWKEEPRLVAGTRLEDETPDEFAERLREAISADPEAFLARGDVVRFEDRLREHAVDRWSDVRSLRDAQLENAWPANPDSCFLHHRTCDFWPVCSGQASADDPVLYQINERMHSELDVREDRSDDAQT